jgi:hypothetical protein
VGHKRQAQNCRGSQNREVTACPQEQDEAMSGLAQG